MVEDLSSQEELTIEAGLDTLVRSHGPAVMRLLIQVLDHRQDAEDAWQEVWFAIWRARDRMARDRDPWPYIRSATLRKALDGRRRRRPAGELVVDPMQPAPAPEVAVGAPDLRSLPPRERACLVLYFWEGMSVGEIAEAMDVPTGTVKTWMFRGRARLRAALVGRKEAP